MSNFFGKVLELKSIVEYKGKSYLHIKLIHEQETNLFWEIDNSTAVNLQKIISFDRIQKYRLSFHSAYDDVHHQFVSSITKTYRDQSTKMSFICSAEYASALKSIKNIHSTDDVNKLPFLTWNLSDEEQNEEQIEEHDIIVNPKRNNSLFYRVCAAIIIIFCFFLYGYSNYPSIDKTEVDETAISNVEAETIEKEEPSSSPSVEVVDDVASAQSTVPQIPYFELLENKTFSLPEGYVALTFDDGPSKFTKEIIDILKDYEVGGTFFFIGKNAISHPHSVQYVQTNGYSIGSHTMNHADMPSLSYAEQSEEINQSVQVIEGITNEKSILFRPPYEEFNEHTEDIVANNGYKMVLWNRDPKDWKTRDADKIFGYVRNTNSSGSIILLHETQEVVDALPRIIEHLLEQNLKIVSLK